MKLYFVRHGETSWNKLHKVQGRADIPLNDYGKYLAKKTAEGLKNKKIDLAYTSPLVRAKETAKIVLGDRKIPLIEEPLIQEMSFGISEGICFKGERKEPGGDEFNKFFIDTVNYKIPEGGESVPELLNRVGRFLQKLYQNEELKDKSILISTHGAALKAMLNCIRGIDSVAQFWGDGVPKNCSVTEVNVENGKPTIVSEGKIYY